MTGHTRASDSDPRSDVGIGRADRPDQDSDDQASHGMSWDGADPDVDPSAGLDAEITAAAKSVFFAPDLIRPGPGLLPFGAKARDRRERRREVDTIAATRRTQLAELLAARRNSHLDKADGATHHGHTRTVAALLTALVIAVPAAGWVMSLPTTTAAPTQNPADTGSATTDLPTYESDPTTPGIAAESTPQPAPAVDLETPEAAAVSWMAAWCPIDPHRDPDSLAAGIRALMTTDGWAQFTATPEQAPADTAPDVTASCDRPVARVVSRPPGSGTTVVVLVSATRIISRPDNTGASERFRVERRQYVLRGDDRLWRVDVPAVGG
jgi:hypothetical protein